MRTFRYSVTKSLYSSYISITLYHNITEATAAMKPTDQPVTVFLLLLDFEELELLLLLPLVQAVAVGSRISGQPP
jgi:hypothetical protein